MDSRTLLFGLIDTGQLHAGIIWQLYNVSAANPVTQTAKAMVLAFINILQYMDLFQLSDPSLNQPNQLVGWVPINN